MVEGEGGGEVEGEKFIGKFHDFHFNITLNFTVITLI